MSDSTMPIARALEVFSIAPPKIDSASADSPEAQLQTWKDGPLKKAWKKLAKERHPDLDKTDGADARFKELGEAYQVLSEMQIARTRSPSPGGSRQWTHEDAANAFAQFEEMLRQTAVRQAAAKARQQQAQERIQRRAQHLAEEIKARKEELKAQKVRPAPAPPPRPRRPVPNPEDYDGPDHAEQSPPPARAGRVPPPSKKPAARKPKVAPADEALNIKQGLDIAEDVLGFASDIGELFGVDAAFGFPKAKKAVRRIRKLIK